MCKSKHLKAISETFILLVLRPDVSSQMAAYVGAQSCLDYINTLIGQSHHINHSIISLCRTNVTSEVADST